MCGIRMRYAAALCAMRKKFVSNMDVSMSGKIK